MKVVNSMENFNEEELTVIPGTWEEFLAIPEGIKVEYDGKNIIYFQTGKATQGETAGNILFEIKSDIKRGNKSCKVWHEQSIRLTTKHDTIHRERIPDVFITCENEVELIDDILNGTPRVVFEVLSPSTAKIDLTDKMDNYQEAGVRDYFIVETKKELVYQYDLTKDVGYQLPVKIHDKTSTLVIESLGMEIAVADIF
jgi:Uma2 family endonuclease